MNTAKETLNERAKRQRVLTFTITPGKTWNEIRITDVIKITRMSI